MLRTRHSRTRTVLLAAGLVASSFATTWAPLAAARSPAVPEHQNGSARLLPLVHPEKQGTLPVVVVVAQGETVLSDFVVPYGVLSQSGAAKVIAVNMTDGSLKAGPLTVIPDMTAAEFDAAYPDGADYVLVPATGDAYAEELVWLRAQHAHGAALVSICDGVELLAQIGVLDGRRATGHWASLRDRRTHYPRVTWLENQRYVADGTVASSAGVSASLPISLALVERIAGPEVARATADRFGVQSWDVTHRSDLFKVRPDDDAVHHVNMSVERDDVVALKIADGEDEVALSLHAEAWSRTMRNKVRLVAETSGSVRMRGGLRVQAEAASSVVSDVPVALAQAAPAGTALPAALDEIAKRYGRGTARLSALGMEYPWGDLKAQR